MHKVVLSRLVLCARGIVGGMCLHCDGFRLLRKQFIHTTLCACVRVFRTVKEHYAGTALRATYPHTHTHTPHAESRAGPGAGIDGAQAVPREGAAGPAERGRGRPRRQVRLLCVMNNICADGDERQRRSSCCVSAERG